MISNRNSGKTTSVTWDTITPATGAERQSKYRKSEHGSEKRRQYKHDTSTWVSLRSYLSRPFIAWDGEGITMPDGSHRYTLFSCSEGRTLQDDDGLKTRDIFEMMLQVKRDTGDAIHVIYGGSYDFNMWMNDIPRNLINRLYETGTCYWQEYRIAWRRGKSFRVTSRESSTTITMYDVVSFFQCAFVKACDDYLGDRFIARDMIVANKAARGKFTTDDNATVAEYNDAELQNLVLLMTELRQRLARVTLRPSRWDGPGAIASALLKREGIKKAMQECPEPVARAGRYAYFGGRFEVIRCGNVTEAAYEYDINSAYPNALQYVPNLQNGEWIETRGTTPKNENVFGVYRCTYLGADENLMRPHPLPVRLPDGRVGYPHNASGWYWAPEIVAAQEYVAKYGGELLIGNGYEFVEDDPDDRPFSFILPMYRKRQALKKAGDGAHVGIKLGLNSLYGKTCQRVGWSISRDGHTIRTPPFHQLEWAGYVTSHCRSLVLRASLENLDNVIAYETDALFTTQPLNVPIGSGLGEWEYTEFSHLCYVQSGFYFGTVNGEPFAKTRGVDRGSLTFADVVESLSQENISERVATASLTRFIGVGLARQLNDWSRWQHWETNPKQIKLDPQGKRVHENCLECAGDGLTAERWHYTYPPFSGIVQSCEYPIPWINPNPDMTDIDDFNAQRREDMAADYE